MRRTILLTLVVLLLVVTTSCPMDGGPGGGTGNPPVILHNPKNLLTVEKSDYTFSRREVFLWFTTPAEFGATSYTLQFSPTGSPYAFETVKSGGGDDLTTSSPDSSGYSIPIPSPSTEGYFRLAIHGGTYDGQFSNIVFATQCMADVYITWSLDYSMFHTGVTSPHVGFGIVAEFTVLDRANSDEPILDALTYKWYRVDPDDYDDREEITGETSLSYTTQDSDVGHHIMVVATGSVDKFSGGFCNAMTDFVITL
ncbi:MAG: hypothetical protein RBR15_14055 [Sphaerochaeta sp.]|nr:hypothetical protein [Sphaerochaeta sp.]